MNNFIQKSKRIIFVISGGVGRNIFATAVIRNLKKTHPDKDIFVVCGCPDIFQYNPHVKRVYSFDKPQHLFEDYIFENKDSYIINCEPYQHPEYIASQKHIVECWCDMIEIPCDSTTPELFYSDNEMNVSHNFIKKFDKPVILLQHAGGKTPDSPSDDQRLIAKDGMYRRSLLDVVAQNITDRLIEDGYIVGSVQHPNQFQPKYSELIYFPIRATIGLIPFVSGIICIDSFLQHAAAALQIPALVCWAGTSPDKLGYPIHTHLRKKTCLTPECHRPNSYVFDVLPNNMMWSCPFNDVCCNYSDDEILAAYKQMKGDKYIIPKKNSQPIALEHEQCPCK